MEAVLQARRVNESNDEELAMRAGQGCRASFARLLERHYDRIYRTAWRFTGVREHAEDVAQDVCIKLANVIGSFRADAKFTTWLHRVTYTTLIDSVRASQRISALDPSDVVKLSDRVQQHHAQAPQDSSDGYDELWQAVRSLPPQQRDAVLFVYAEELSHAQAASVMGCSEKTVSWHIHEAKKRLKILLKAVG